MTRLLAAPDIDRVTLLLREVIATIVMPRFRHLQDGDVKAKPSARDPHDVVSIVDQAVEARLTPALGALLAGSVVVGEEAAAERPSVVDALKTALPVWVIDPIDGTKNFVRGEDAFGVMLSLVQADRTRAAWVALPARGDGGQMFVAEDGGGVYRDGERLRLPGAAPPLLRGSVAETYLTDAVRERVEGWNDGRFRPVPLERCAACDYTAVAEGRKDFVLYHRLLPWDHAAPALILVEAGGAVKHVDGRMYAPSSADQPTVAAGSAAIADEVRAWLSA